MMDLAPYAVPIEGSLGRVYPDPPDEFRNPFQRDRDRIIHSHSFRRLQGKTQVFEAGESDHVRTRLTHTLEVAQISRDMARRLMLNEDLSECIALSHDLGHPPFGHSGEDALDEWMEAHGEHFEHNEQSLRIVTTLEYHSGLYLGLNLSGEVLEGMQKHTDLSFPDETPKMHSMEAQLVNLCDEIAYTSHDCDDGIRTGIITVKDLTDVPLAKRAHQQSHERGTHLRGTLIRLMAEDLLKETKLRLEREAIKTLRDVERSRDLLVEFSKELRSELNELRNFLMQKLYLDPRVAGGKAEGKEIVKKLCTAYEQKPDAHILDLQKRTGSSLIIAIKDYVAGMTDAFAREQVRAM